MNALRPIEKIIGNVEAELVVIAAALCEPSTIDPLRDVVKPDDFADAFLGYIFELIEREHNLGRTLNPVTIRPFLEKEQAFADLGGWPWLASLTDNKLSLLAAKESARQVATYAQRRRLIEGLRETIAQAGDIEEPVEEVMDAAEAAISKARNDKSASFERSAADCLKTLIDNFNEPVAGVLCGNILSVDQLLGPLRPTHLIIGAGRPGMGKTATAVSYALGAAERGHGVLFISLEMSGDELAERMAADLCLEQRIPYEAIRDRKLSNEQMRHICRAHDRLAAMPLQIADRGGLSISQLRSIVRRRVRRFQARGHKLELVVIDYLQLMRGDRDMDRYEVVSEVSRTLKEIAKEHQLAVFALAQLSRAVEQRSDKRPILSDLRESGQIEQDADAVLFFLREEYYLRQSQPYDNDPKRDAWDKAMQQHQGRIEFICAKRRNGQIGNLTGEFLYHYQAVR